VEPRALPLPRVGERVIVWIVLGVVVAAMLYLGGRALLRVDRAEYKLMSRGPSGKLFPRYRDQPPKDDE
jgi:hypothetical protein